jgi:uncharacterized protein (DUF983 family)
MTRPDYVTALLRGLRKRCPRCGIGRLYKSWQMLNETCPHCGLTYEPGQGDTWAFMYLTTAFITGLLIIGMLWIIPTRQWLGRIVLASAALLAIVCTLPYRKGLSIALDYLLAERRHGSRDPDEPPRSESREQ